MWLDYGPGQLAFSEYPHVARRCPAGRHPPRSAAGQLAWGGALDRCSESKACESRTGDEGRFCNAHEQFHEGRAAPTERTRMFYGRDA